MPQKHSVPALEAPPEEAEPRWFVRKGEPLQSPRLESLLDELPRLDGGLRFEARGRRIATANAVHWLNSFENLDAKFGSWARVCAVAPDIGDLKSYFGRPFEIMDFKRRRLIWRRAFEMLCEDVPEKGVRPPETVLETLEKELDFEDLTGLSKVSNPWAYPKRTYMLAELGGFEQAEAALFAQHADKGTEQSAAEICALLEGAWNGSGKAPSCETAAAENALKNDAAESYATGDYDAIGVYERFREKVCAWANRRWGDPLYGKTTGEVRALACRMLAMRRMIDLQYEIVKAIGERAEWAQNREPERLDDKRIAGLARGTKSVPA